MELAGIGERAVSVCTSMCVWILIDLFYFLRIAEAVKNVETNIARVELEISEVELKLDAKPKPKEVAYLRKEKERLGKEKEQLRDKENKLRDKEAQLREKELLAQRGGPSGPAASCCFFILGCAH